MTMDLCVKVKLDIHLLILLCISNNKGTNNEMKHQAHR